MAFGDAYEKSKNRPENGAARDSAYLSIKPGIRIIRIMDNDTTMFWRYWLQVNGRPKGASVVVGVNGPIKKYMDSIGEDHPKFSRPSRRFLVNVVDRTPMLVKTDGTTEYANERGVFSDTKSVPQVLNRLKIFEFGPTIMDGLTLWNKRSRHPKTAELMSIQDFDLSIIRRGDGRDATTQVAPSSESDFANPIVDSRGDLVTFDRMYDLATMVTPMPDEGQERLLNGEDYNEVMKSMGFEPVKPLW